jgi:hypothetical protein
VTAPLSAKSKDDWPTNLLINFQFFFFQFHRDMFPFLFLAYSVVFSSSFSTSSGMAVGEAWEAATCNMA